MKILLGSVPQGWSHLHVECLPSGAASAYVGLIGTTTQWLTVPPEAANALVQYLVRTTTGSPGAQRLVVDCFPDGRLSARTEPADSPANVVPTPPLRRSRRWPRRFLMAVTVACVTAAALVFAFGWRWTNPPEADIELLPPPSPREQQAFEVVTEWFTALANRDMARVHELSCANPTGYALNDVQALQGGFQGGIDYAEAIVKLRDNGSSVLAKVVFRTKPLTESERREVEERQLSGNGLAYRPYVLIDEGGALKVCGGE